MTTATKAGAAPRTIEELRRALAAAEENRRTVCAGGQPTRDQLAAVRAVIFGHEELACTDDRDAALARGRGLLPEHSKEAVERLLFAPGALPRAKSTLAMLEGAEAEQAAKEAEAHAPVVAARDALYAALADEVRCAWRAYVPVLAAGAEAFSGVLARAPVGHPDGIDVTELAQLAQQVRGVAVRLGRRVNPAPAPKGPKGFDGERLKAGRRLVRVVVDSLFDRGRNVVLGKHDVLDVSEVDAKDLVRQKAVELVAQ